MSDRVCASRWRRGAGPQFNLLRQLEGQIESDLVPVIAFGGDGATFSEGIGHLIHGVRSNLSHHVRAAQQYKLRADDRAGEFAHATGPANEHEPQRDPRADVGEHGPDLLFSLNPTFVARGFSGGIKRMNRILKAAIQHRGFAFVEMLQACPTCNHFATHEYLLDRYFDANADGHDPSDLQQAGALATQIQDRIACGVPYQREDIPHFYDRPILRQGLATTCVEEVRRYDVSEYWKELV